MNPLLRPISTFLSTRRSANEGNDTHSPSSLVAQNHEFHTSMAPDIVELLLGEFATQPQWEGAKIIDESKGVLCWETIQRVHTVDETTDEKFKAAVPFLKFMAKQSHRYLLSLSPEQFCEHYKSCFALTHGHVIAKLFELLTVGEEYTSFIIGIVVLERALFEVFVNETKLAKGTEANDGSSTHRALTGGLILRDLLATEELANRMPAQCLPLLRVLFLPKALNLRNIVWHGFIAPHEFAGEFAALVLMLLVSLPLATASERREEMWAVNALDSQLPNIVLDFALPSPGSSEAQQLEELVDRTLFVVAERQQLLKTAFRAFFEGHEILFLFLALPVVEHALRRIFCVVNETPELLCAATAQYYSTLDGFGQRTKHQLLLHNHVLSTNKENRVVDAVGRGAFAVLVDLFMMENGPGLRGKLCHGEANLASLFTAGDPQAISKTCRLFYFTTIALCAQFDSTRPISSQPSCVLECTRLINTYASSFHPDCLLQRDLLRSARSVNELAQLTAQRSGRIENILAGQDAMDTRKGVGQDEECIAVVTVLPHNNCAPSVYRVRDKTQVICATNRAPNVGLCSLVDMVQQWGTLLDGCIEQLRAKMSRAGLECELVGLDSATANIGAMLWLQSEADVCLEPFVGVACLRTMCGEVERMCNTLVLRVTSLESAISTMTARTGHRRQYIATLQVLRCFVQLSVLTLMIVEHVARTKPEHWIVATKWLSFIGSFSPCVMSEEGKTTKGFDKAIPQCTQFLGSKAVTTFLSK